nr:hypothetical protein [Methylomarinum sp. Ch1-1]MDP4521911.1 hypothetical protein [Methylomarinum sp. Ch1-1]
MSREIYGNDTNNARLSSPHFNFGNCSPHLSNAAGHVGWISLKGASTKDADPMDALRLSTLRMGE